MAVTVTWNDIGAYLLRPGVIICEALTSHAYKYSFLGIWYTLRHPRLWPFLIAILIPHLILMALCFALLFILIYPLQTFIFFFFQGPNSIYTSFVMVFQEATVITSMISDLFLFPAPSAYLFDVILISEGFNDFLLMGKSTRRKKVPFMQRMSKFWLHQLPWFFLCPWWLFQILLVFGLNLIPFLGPILVMFVKAPTIGIKYHKRYLDLRYKDPEMAKRFISKNRGNYFAFGLTAAMWEMIPVVGFFFKFTNIVGSCLWSCDLIRKEIKVFEEMTREQLINIPKGET